MNALLKFSVKKILSLHLFMIGIAIVGFSFAGTLFLHAKPVPETQMITQEKRITGKVIDSDGEPVIGANVVVKNTNTGVITDMDGNFELTVPSSAQTLIISYIGYSRVEVNLDNRTFFHIVMESDSERLDEVVVTAMGIKREKKALGYAMQEIKSETFVETRAPSLSNMLQGKIAGVQIGQSSSGIGGSTRVILRGLNSLSGNNSPLWVIDGIPIDDSDNGEVTQWGGSDVAGGASDLNPDDIESISVLKGPNAAALYGSRAANGVILVTTKKAQQGQPISVTYNGNFSWSKVYDGYDYQWKYGQGNAGVFNPDSETSWGPEMTGQKITHWKNHWYSQYGYDLPDYEMFPQKDRIKDFFRTGSNIANNIAIEGGGEHLAARFSFTDSRNNGIVDNNNMVRDYFDLNVNYQYQRLNVNLKGSYIKQEVKNRVGLGVYGLMHMFNVMPGNIRLSDLRDWEAVDGMQMNWSGTRSDIHNPYALTTDKKTSIDERDRFIGVATVNFKITDWLGITGKAGQDYILNHSHSYGLKTYLGENPIYYMGEYRINEGNYDLMLNFNKDFGRFSVLANAGTAMRRWEKYEFNANSGNLVLEGLYRLSNSEKINTSVGNNYYEKEVHSVLGNVQIGFDNWLYLDVTARNDWSSTLNPSNWSYFYPSVSVSGVLSEVLKLPDFIPFLKVRGSWAQVGNDTDPYQLYSTVWLNTMNGSTKFGELPTTKPLYDLQPEETTSWEVGLDARFLENRLGIDFTYYHANTKNQILSLESSPTTGYTNQWINAGEIKSHGVELSITSTPIKTRDWQWDLNVNWGFNRSECVTLNDEIKRHTLGGFNVADVVVDEGGKFGDIVGKGFLRDDNGNILLQDNGIPIATEDNITLGNMLPDWTGSVYNMLRFKNFTFHALLDIKKGGDIVSITDAIATQNGTSPRTLDGRDGMIVEGIFRSTGEKNTNKVTAEEYWNAIGGYNNGIAEAYMYDGSYIMLRELSFGYIVPQQYLAKTRFVKKARVSFVGRDLGYLLKNTPGTTPENASTRQDWVQAFDLNSLPPSRNFGINVNLTF